MTEQEKRQIECYLPNPRDSDLEDGWYYVLDIRNRPIKVRIANIAFDRYGEDIVQVFTESGRLVHGCYETDSETLGGGWYQMGALYDNREDCRYSVHSMCNYWERLREIQKGEGQNV